MASIQISKIQLRRGNLNEIVTGTLDPAEFGMAVDAGRLFIGPGNGAGDAQYAERGGTPGNNIEVLTEASLETFARLFDRMNRLAGPTAMAAGALERKPFLEGDLTPTTASNWAELRVKEIQQNGAYNEDNSGVALILSATESAAATIRYFIFDSDVAVRSGTIDILDTSDNIQMIDDYNIVETAPSGVYATFAAAYGTVIKFRATKDGQDRLRIDYQNQSATTFRIQLQATVAARRF